MASELDKYKAQNLQITGFSITVPFGKLVLDLFEVDFSYNILKFSILLVISIVFLFIGIIIILQGMEHLR